MMIFKIITNNNNKNNNNINVTIANELSRLQYKKKKDSVNIVRWQDLDIFP